MMFFRATLFEVEVSCQFFFKDGYRTHCIRVAVIEPLCISRSRGMVQKDGVAQYL